MLFYWQQNYCEHVQLYLMTLQKSYATKIGVRQGDSLFSLPYRDGMQGRNGQWLVVTSTNSTVYKSMARLSLRYILSLCMLDSYPNKKVTVIIGQYFQKSKLTLILSFCCKRYHWWMRHRIFGVNQAVPWPRGILLLDRERNSFLPYSTHALVL